MSASPQLHKKKSIDDLGNLSGKKVLIRVDFNVPVNEEGVITNDLRIRAALPTIQHVVNQGGKAILMSHLGRPKGIMYEGTPLKPSSDGTLKPVALRLEELLNKESSSSAKKPGVAFADDCLDAQSAVDALENGQVLVLENVRFYKNESSKVEAERMLMAKQLASYGDVYVSDAFGTAHRNAASVTGIPVVLGQAAAGYLMLKEVEAFRQILVDPPRPFCAIVGGSKVSDKILLLEQLMEKVDKLLIGGAMAYTFLKAQGKEIGKSYCQEGEMLDLANKLLEKAKTKGIDVQLPIDHVCNTEFSEAQKPHVTDGPDIPEDMMALDIGPKTIALYKTKIDDCGATLWNGPMGVFEMKAYETGTFTIAQTLGDLTASKGLVSIIGGGDSAAAAEISGQAVRMTHVSTGGGASLELLEGKKLPGIEALDNA